MIAISVDPLLHEAQFIRLLLPVTLLRRPASGLVNRIAQALPRSFPIHLQLVAEPPTPDHEHDAPVRFPFPPAHPASSKPRSGHATPPLPQPSPPLHPTAS